MNQHYEKLYRKYKGKYILLSNKLKIKGGAVASGEVCPNEICTMNRKWSGETTVIIGCGNGPIVGVKGEADTIKFAKDHAHEGVYTIDIDKKMNPSCLTDSRTGHFCDIPNNTIDNIIFEGFTPKLSESKKFIDEINRIKTPNGTVITTMGDIQTNESFMNRGTFRSFITKAWDDNIYNKPVFLTYDQAFLYFYPENNKDFERDQSGYMILYLYKYKDDAPTYTIIDQDTLKKSNGVGYRDVYLKYNNTEEYIKVPYSRLFDETERVYPIPKKNT